MARLYSILERTEGVSSLRINMGSDICSPKRQFFTSV